MSCLGVVGTRVFILRRQERLRQAYDVKAWVGPDVTAT
jgi:hypothetical protein